ncbi:hypothetical protein [Streptomyces sp. TverLS-915]|uniref:hypothetical protein n=1 Tax=Streptomyces sp. TverLS-915 TaxID=1839763 RepID=UPI0026A93364
MTRAVSSASPYRRASATAASRCSRAALSPSPPVTATSRMSPAAVRRRLRSAAGSARAYASAARAHTCPPPSGAGSRCGAWRRMSSSRRDNRAPGSSPRATASVRRARRTADSASA